MSQEKHDPWALLREARKLVGFCPTTQEGMDIVGAVRDRIDATLTEEANEQNPCRPIDVGDGGMSRERAEADAFRRGAEAMREAAVQRLFAVGGENAATYVLQLPLPEDK
jgi:hypothetical protein